MDLIQINFSKMFKLIQKILKTLDGWMFWLSVCLKKIFFMFFYVQNSSLLRLFSWWFEMTLPTSVTSNLVFLWAKWAFMVLLINLQLFLKIGVSLKLLLNQYFRPSLNFRVKLLFFFNSFVITFPNSEVWVLITWRNIFVSFLN